MDINYSSLLLLLKATSKNQVKTIVRLAHKTPPLTKILLEIQKEMGVSPKEFSELIEATTRLTLAYMRDWPLEFPANFHDQLKELLLSILAELKTEIRKESRQPSLPKLIDFDWRLDLQTASSGLERSPRIPVCLLELNLDNASHIVQLDRQRISTLIQNLSKVKEQLDTLAESN